MSHFFEATHALHQNAVPFVVVTMIGTRGHAPQDPGAKMVVLEEGLHHGTIGGGKIEARCLEHAQKLLKNRAGSSPGNPAPELITWNLQRDIGMSCGGEVTVLFELHARDAWNIVIFGAGHVAQALCRALLPLECKITLVDPRADWIQKLPSSPKLHPMLSENPPALVSSLNPNSFFVVMTRGHASDLPVLKEISKNHPNAPYVGVLGSKVKAIKIRGELKEFGASASFIEKLRCPMGLDFGGNDPAEIAISIAAELIQRRDQLKASSS